MRRVLAVGALVAVGVAIALLASQHESGVAAVPETVVADPATVTRSSTQTVLSSRTETMTHTVTRTVWPVNLPTATVVLTRTLTETRTIRPAHRKR